VDNYRLDASVGPPFLESVVGIPEPFGHGELPVDRMRGVAPHRTASLAQPGIEFDERAEATGRGFDPDAPAAVLHVLLDHTLLPARGDVAEVGVEQVVAAYSRESRVDGALLAALHLVHGGAHVVVDAAPGGLFGGDGCTSISNQQVKGRKNLTYRLRLYVAQNCKETPLFYPTARDTLFNVSVRWPLIPRVRCNGQTRKCISKKSK
jgi:hypothetical protein